MMSWFPFGSRSRSRAGGSSRPQSTWRTQVSTPPAVSRCRTELTLHGLRRTFASVLVAIGENPNYVMGQMGHTDPQLTLRIYTQQMQRRDGEQERLRVLVNGDHAAATGTSAQSTGARRRRLGGAPRRRKPRRSGAS